MQSTLRRPAETVFKTAAPATPKTTTAYWISTALFCLLMAFTAYAELRLPQVADAFTHLGFPGYFRVELSWAKLIGVVLMLARVPARLSGNNAAWTRTACALKEWVYAGFAFDLASRRSPICQWALAPPRGAGPRRPACSGCSRTSRGVASRPSLQAPLALLAA
jgi:hypothetical protein